MQQKLSLQGFSIVKIIIIIFVLAIIGVGSYFAYFHFIAPQSTPYAQLIPTSLQTYSIGKDADAFVIYKKDQAIEDEIKKLPAPVSFISDIQDAIILIKAGSGINENIFAAIEFTSAEKAQEAKTKLDNLNQYNTPFPFELKDKFLLVSTGEGLKGFNGSLLDNPGLKQIDQTIYDSQLIGYSNNLNLPDAGGLLPAIISMLPDNSFPQPPTASIGIKAAHAQGTGFLSATDSPSRIVTAISGESAKNQAIQTATMFTYLFKETIFYLKLKQDILSSNINITIVPKDAIATSPLNKFVNSQMPTSDINTVYDDTLKKFKDTLPNIQNALNSRNKTISNLTTDLLLENNTLTFKVSIPTNDLNNFVDYVFLPISLGAPQKARNAARKADINNLIAAIETYYSENDHYPQTSGCLETLTELNKYYFKEITPKDPQGSQSFDNNNCSSGYYYQYVPRSSTTMSSKYLLWAKTEGSQGKTDETPSSIVNKLEDINFLTKIASEQKGQYYFVIQTDSSDTTSTTSADLSSNSNTFSPSPSINAPKVRRHQ